MEGFFSDRVLCAGYLRVGLTSSGLGFKMLSGFGRAEMGRSWMSAS